MRKGLPVLVIAALLTAPSALGHAQESAPAKAQPAEVQTQPVAPKTPNSGRADAAEARYRAWVDREHAQDAAVFQSEKAKIEDKYKGYVRPPHEKKTGKSKKTSESTGN